MNPDEFSKEELVKALEKMREEYPACYRSFVLYNLSPEKYEEELRRIYGP
jgi:hypothetical protein